MKKYDTYWCWWMSRYLLFIEKEGNKFLFEDYGDERFLLTEEEVSKLVKK